jgi:hypothetical protein
MNLTVSIIASEIGLPLCGGFAYSYFSNCALDGPAATFLRLSTKKSETGTPLCGSSFFSSWALEGGDATFLSPSTKKSETGTPLYGSSLWSNWALDGGVVTFLRPSMKKSETGTPLCGSSFSFFSNCALDGPAATFLRLSTKKSETGTPLYGSSFLSTYAILWVGLLAFVVNEFSFLSSFLPIPPIPFKESITTSDAGDPLYGGGSSFLLAV